MFGTVVAVISVLVLVLPGFVIADLQRRKRASVAADSDWELVLRALFYSLILHLAVSPWTRSVVMKIEDGDWENHVNSLIAYGLVVLVVLPAAVGLALNELKLKSGGAIAGKLGRHSWASQSPAPDGHDLWLEEIWTVDDVGSPAEAVEPRQGMWVGRDDIDALFVIDPPGG